jgi:excisionase family DNA binding protein
VPKRVTREATDYSAAVRRLKQASLTPRAAKPLTAREVADLCGVELKTIHNWVTDGRLDHFRTPGRHLRFQAADVLHFLERCGYRASLPTQATALVVAEEAVRRSLVGALREYRTERTSDAFEALFVAARLTPDLIVVHGRSLAGLNAEQWCRAVRLALPQARLLVVDYKRALSAAERIRLAELPSRV